MKITLSLSLAFLLLLGCTKNTLAPKDRSQTLSVGSSIASSEPSRETNSEVAYQELAESFFLPPSAIATDITMSNLAVGFQDIIIPNNAAVNMLEFMFCEVRENKPMLVQLDKDKVTRLYSAGNQQHNINIWQEILVGEKSLHELILEEFPQQKEQIQYYVGDLYLVGKDQYEPVLINDSPPQNLSGQYARTYKTNGQTIEQLLKKSYQAVLQTYPEIAPEELSCMLLNTNTWYFWTYVFFFYTDTQEFIVSPEGYHYQQDFLEAQYLLPEERREYILEAGKVYELRTSDLLPFVIEEKKLWDKVSERIRTANGGLE